MKALLPGLVIFAAGVALAQEEADIFAFIPDGGRTILSELLTAGPGIAEATAEQRSAAEWSAWLADSPAAADLDTWEMQTLADYLGYAGAITDLSDLPPDGRDMTLARCQSCHIVTVVVTQARTREAWLGTMNKPSHVEVPLSADERGQLADYLVVNGGLPIDVVPPELRAGGASY